MGAMAELAGEDNLIWASDFPHSDAKYPGVVDELMESVASMPAERARKLVGANAARIYGIDAQYSKRMAVIRKRAAHACACAARRATRGGSAIRPPVRAFRPGAASAVLLASILHRLSIVRLRVATLNVWAVPLFSERIGTRMREIGRRLAALELDAIAFQEVWTRQRAAG